MCSLRASFLLAMCIVVSVSVCAQRSQSDATVLTNKDVLEMLNAQLSQEIVIAKIKASNSKFDTSPETLKALKAANVPDAVILAMVQAPAPTPERVLRVAKITCMDLREIPLLSSPTSFRQVGQIKCDEQISVLEEKDPWRKIKTSDGTVAYVAMYFVSDAPQSKSDSRANADVSQDAQPSAGRTLPPNMLHAIAWRGVPWVTTSYYQQQGSSNTECTGSGTWFGNIWQGNSSCTTQYTPAQSIPVNWQHYTIYNLVETSDSTMVVACTRNWAFSKCAYLIPGNFFEFEDRNGKILIKGHKAGKDKEVDLALDIVSSEPRTGR